MRLQPKPTEYNGVRFRSKSEAVFAYTLDCCNITWFYEPKYDPEGHSWDFLVFWPFEAPNIIYHKSSSVVYQGPTETRYDPVFIEYKPVAPSSTYVDCLCNEVRRSRTRVHCLIVFGNPWDGETYDYINLPGGHRSAIGEEICGNCLLYMGDGKRFRFDLRQRTES